MDPGIIISLLTLVAVVLNTVFGRGDKGTARVDELEKRHAAKIDALEESQHQHALAMKDLEARMRDHIGGGYATKSDIAGLREEIAGFRLIFEPIANQLGLHAVRRGG